MPRKFTCEEIQNIINDYNIGMPLYKIEKKYNRKSSVIISMLKRYGAFKASNKRWTQEEIVLLKNNYSQSSWKEILSLIPKHDKESIITKACKLKIKRDVAFWSESDIEILKESYKNHLSTDAIRDVLNNKFTSGAILAKANKLGLIRNSKWSQVEINILKSDYSNLSLDELCNLLPNRNRSSIISKARKMNLYSHYYNEKKWDESEVIFLLNNYMKMSDESIGEVLCRSKDSIRGKRDVLKLYHPVESCTYDLLSEYIRKRNRDWKRISAKKCDYKCIVTGEQFKEIHHLYGMNLIIKEVLQKLDIGDKENFEDYTEKELSDILAKFYEVQSTYPLGICLSKWVHKDFHDTYGYGNNTPDQFEAYLKKYKIKIA